MKDEKMMTSSALEGASTAAASRSRERESEPVAWLVAGPEHRYLQWTPEVADADRPIVTVTPLYSELSAAQRVETGVVQFDGDWPGVFIRGDNAFKYLSGLGRVLELIGTPTDPMDRLAVGAARGLAQLLARSNKQYPEHKVDREIPLFAHPHAVPEGWKLVPMEPTEEMCKAGENCDGNAGPGPWLDGGHKPENVEKIYRAMLSSSPPYKG